ncbi:MAG: sulfite exporter TauE/SafE family protein [Gammaproteobacteria bacterium]|nr:sulfite exporter TauE/SafE family protein [Gammaproteobacteria bacterium]
MSMLTTPTAVITRQTIITSMTEQYTTLAAAMLAAAAAGLAGSGHCFGMCGGIAALAGQRGRHSDVLLINLGRLGGYAVIGTLGAGLLAAGLGVTGLTRFAGTSRLLVGSLLLLVAISMLVGGHWLAGLNRFAGQLWQRLQPLTGKLLPVQSAWQALAFGMLWGWLPCGLVYAVAPVAWSSGNAASGALIMAAFGAGTLPSMSAMGLATGRIRRWLKSPRVKLFSGLLVLLSALSLLYGPIMHWLLPAAGHQHMH